MTVYRSKLPFSVVSSSVTTGYNADLNANFKQGADITGHHQDTYGGLENEPLQTTFTRTYVGGNQHRHVPINTGADNDFTRPEAFKIKAQSSQLRIYGPDFENVNKPRAQQWLGAKSPINITNIPHSGNLVGNYSKNYEVINTVGRRQTNSLIVDGFIASGTLTTQFITGANNYSLPNIVNNSKSIIVERFNAPGSKEASSRGALDRAGEELSPNNSLTTRNILVRQTFYSQLTQHAAQFGSGSVEGISIHKVNRNSKRRLQLSGSTVISASAYDNYWVQHAIPQDNFGYAWITASSISNPYTIGTASLQFDFTSSLSTIKDKDILLSTQTISGTMKNVDGYYSTWKQIRTGDHPVARKLREANIVAVQDEVLPTTNRFEGGYNTNKAKRSGTSTNYIDPPVSNKHRPLEQDIQFVSEPDGSSTKIKYTYENNSSKFANEDLQERLGLQDQQVEFYKKLVEAKNKTTNSPIKNILSLTFQENIFPKEVNTYLSGTRSRTQYITDQAGFDRNGYDRRLGTQRVFWRDSQANRKRSANSAGGHINSLGYSSLSESGSNFTQNDSGILFDNSFINHSGTFTQNFSNFDSGINNSIIMLESGSAERELFSYTGSFIGTFYNNGNIAYKTLADIVKRGYTSDIAGEFNNSYIDFYEQFLKNNQKQSIGTIYRNSQFRGLINDLPTSRANLPDAITQTDDESVFPNPKPRYVAFVGGGELNTGSLFDNSSNFTGEYFNTFISGVALAGGIGGGLGISSILPVGNKIYFGGFFGSIGGIPADFIAVYDKTTQRFSQVGTSSFNSVVYALAVSGTDIYAGGLFTTPGKRVAKYDTLTNIWSPLSGGLDNSVSALVVSGTDIYAGGAFTTTGSCVVRWSTIPGGNWTALSGGLSGNNAFVSTLLVSGTDIYAGGLFTTTGSNVARWSTLPGGNWSPLSGGLDNSVYALVVSGTDIYAGGAFTTTGSKTARWSTITNTWSNTSAIGGIANGTVTSLAVSGTDLYAFGNFSLLFDGVSLVDPKNTAKYNTSTYGWSLLSGGLNSQVATIAASGTDIYAGGFFDTTGSCIAKWSTRTNNWSVFNTNDIYNTFTRTLLNNAVDSSSVLFSTLDNGLINNKTATPFYDKSDEYYKTDIYQIGKDYSILAEYRVSEHISDIVVSGGNFQKDNKQFLSIDGVGNRYKSALSANSLTYDNSFFEKYSYTDVVNKNDIESDYSRELDTETISINVSGIKKLLPYNGFYPQDRTVQLANLYGDYVDSVLSGGIYNVNNVNDFYNNRILSGNFLGTPTAYGELNSSIDVERYGNKYFLIQNTTGSIGRSYLYSSSASSYKDFSQNVIYQYDNHSGSRIISASNGLNIYSFSVSASFSASYNHLSTNGTTWSTPVAVVQPHSASDGFGEYWDYIYENNPTIGEKILFSIAAPYVTVGGKTNGGVVSFVSATMKQYANGSKYWEYSNKVTLGTGSAANNRFGTGISMISCSSGYQVFMGEMFGDTTSTNFGNIWVITSSNGTAWSTPVSIVSGSVPSSSIGFNNIKAVNFTKDGISRSYLFFTEPLSFSSGSSNVVGKFFVVSSSINNNWGTTSINSQRTELYSAISSTTTSGTLFDVSGSSRYSIEAYANSDSITYCFVNGMEDTEEIFSEIIIGSTYNGTTWQTGDQMFRQINNSAADTTTNKGCELVALSTYEKDGKQFPVFFTNLSSSAGINSIYAFANNQYTQYTLNISGTEKYVKQAALEPVMAPGILYNTIKSGIAVDWPCATGSQTAIQPYGSGTIVNAYYPQSFKMASSTGQNIPELNMYGSLRSNIDYRVNFEKLIFPDDIFAIKNPLTSSLVETTTLSTLDENSSLVSFISGCYIYGGYEPYVSPVDVSDYNQLGPKKFSVPFVYKREGARETGLYSMAMSNFLAETVKFFLKDQLLTSFQSKPDNQWETFISGKKYYMDIVLSRSPDLVMMEAYHDSKHPTGSRGEKMNGRYFGYPVNKTNKKLWTQQSDQLFTSEESRVIHNDPAYAPYTPPYFEGRAVARVSFSPTITRKYSLDEVLAGLVIEDIFPGVARGAHTGSDAYINKMPVEASLNIKGKLPWVDTTRGDQNTSTTNNDVNTWIIGTRFETPVLDFSSQQLTRYSNSYTSNSGYGRGMWSGYGSIPTANSGIYVSLQESFPQKLNRVRSFEQSLLEKVGFTQNSKKVGLIAETKEISEAVMIIPFIEIADQKTALNRKYSYGGNSRRSPTEISLGIHFIGVDKKIYNEVITNNITGSILDTYNDMSRFIVPPQLDYKKFSYRDPFVAYIAEFKHTLSQQDLADIWQGVEPQIATKAELENVSITQKNSRTDFYHGQGMPKEDIRFMVFKIKQKGEFNYFKVTKDSTDDLAFSFEQKIGRSIDDYSYNWPYDYFSLVELAKVDLQIGYKKKK